MRSTSTSSSGLVLRVGERTVLHPELSVDGPQRGRGVGGLEHLRREEDLGLRQRRRVTGHGGAALCQRVVVQVVGDLREVEQQRVPNGMASSFDGVDTTMTIDGTADGLH